MARWRSSPKRSLKKAGHLRRALFVGCLSNRLVVPTLLLQGGEITSINGNGTPPALGGSVTLAQLLQHYLENEADAVTDLGHALLATTTKGNDADGADAYALTGEGEGEDDGDLYDEDGTQTRSSVEKYVAAATPLPLPLPLCPFSQVGDGLVGFG